MIDFNNIGICQSWACVHFLSRVEISRASYEPLDDVEAHLKHFKPPQPL